MLFVEFSGKSDLLKEVTLWDSSFVRMCKFSVDHSFRHSVRQTKNALINVLT